MPLTDKPFYKLKMRCVYIAALGLFIAGFTVISFGLYTDREESVFDTKIGAEVSFPDSEEKMEIIANKFLTAEGFSTIAPAAGTEQKEPLTEDIALRK